MEGHCWHFLFHFTITVLHISYTCIYIDMWNIIQLIMITLEAWVINYINTVVHFYIIATLLRE